ncbi:hypothetical protein JHK87_027996 [Glycine soja]|nr:hypothetical protein JHK87_027996 [Glycine soja]
MEEGKETKEMKRQKSSRRDRQRRGEEQVKSSSSGPPLELPTSLHDAKVLFKSNSNLSSLKLRNTFQHKIVLSTPNLSSLTIIDHYGVSHEPLSSPSNLSCLEEGTIDTDTNISYSVFIGWLQVFTNVKILTLSSDTLRLLKELSNLPTMRTQPPRFVRLETLKVKMIPYVEISYEELKRAVEYLLQNSQLIRVVVIKC